MQLPGVDHRRDHRYQPQTHHMLATAFRAVGSLCLQPLLITMAAAQLAYAGSMTGHKCFAAL